MISDLHWLIHQGHVIEFANGVMDTAKKPLPKPPKPEAKPTEAGVEAAAPYTLTAVEIGSGSVSITSAVLGDGTYTLEATVTDQAGNERPAATSAPGSLDLQAGSDSAVTTDDYTIDSTPTFDIALPAEAVAGDVVTLYDGLGNTLGTLTLTGADITAGTVALTSAALADGYYTLEG